MLLPLTEQGIFSVVKEPNPRGSYRLKGKKRCLSDMSDNDRVKAIKTLSDYSVSEQDYKRTFVVPNQDEQNEQPGVIDAAGRPDAAAAGLGAPVQ